MKIEKYRKLLKTTMKLGRGRILEIAKIWSNQYSTISDFHVLNLLLLFLAILVYFRLICSRKILCQISPWHCMLCGQTFDSFIYGMIDFSVFSHQPLNYVHKHNKRIYLFANWQLLPHLLLISFCFLLLFIPISDYNGFRIASPQHTNH